MSNRSAMRIESTNGKFWSDFIDWLNAYPDGSGSVLTILANGGEPAVVVEGTLELESVDDGGQARVASLHCGDGMFFRVQSWDEAADDKPDVGHERFRQFEGKKVRITLEVIDEE